MFLLLVCGDDFLKTQLEDSDWVSELLLAKTTSRAALLSAVGCSLRLVEGLIVELDRFVSFLESLLELFYLELEFLLLFLVFCLQSKDLIVGFISVFAALDVILVGSYGFFLNALDSLAHGYDTFLGEEDLLSHNVDLSFQILVAADCVVKAYALIG